MELINKNFHDKVMVAFEPGELESIGQQMIQMVDIVTELCGYVFADCDKNDPRLRPLLEQIDKIKECCKSLSIEEIKEVVFTGE